MAESNNNEWYEVFDGVMVVHRGYTFNYDIPGEDRPIEIIDMYDMQGNKFYGNFLSYEEAEAEIKKQAKGGIELVLGPQAPCRDPQGRPIPNKTKNGVGLYMVHKEIEKSKTKEKKN